MANLLYRFLLGPNRNNAALLSIKAWKNAWIYYVRLVIAVPCFAELPALAEQPAQSLSAISQDPCSNVELAFKRYNANVDRDKDLVAMGETEQVYLESRCPALACLLISGYRRIQTQYPQFPPPDVLKKYYNFEEITSYHKVCEVADAERFRRIKNVALGDFSELMRLHGKRQHDAEAALQAREHQLLKSRALIGSGFALLALGLVMTSLSGVGLHYDGQLTGQTCDLGGITGPCRYETRSVSLAGLAIGGVSLIVSPFIIWEGFRSRPTRLSADTLVK